MWGYVRRCGSRGRGEHTPFSMIKRVTKIQEKKRKKRKGQNRNKAVHPVATDADLVLEVLNFGPEQYKHD